MHIVAITGDFYPILMAPSACFKPYLVELARENEVDVVCPSNVYENSRRVRVDAINIHFISNHLNSLIIKASAFFKKRNCVSAIRFLDVIVRFIVYFREMILPKPYDSSLEKAYLKELELLDKQDKIDTVISVTFPFSTHVVALKYKKKHPSVKWLSYTTDPLAYNEANPLPSWKKHRAASIEREVYENSDYCLITEELSQNVINDYNIPQSKVVVLPYLLETENLIVDPKRLENERPQVTYAGCLFYRVRNPQKMLSVFSKIKTADLNLYVTGDRMCRNILKGVFPNNITINNVVPRNEYLRLLRNSDVLINLSNNAKLQAPHKLLELISTGRPIINFYYHVDSGFKLVEKYPLGLNVSNSASDDDAVGLISGFLGVVRDKYINAEEIMDLYPERLLSAQMPILLKLIAS